MYRLPETFVNTSVTTATLNPADLIPILAFELALHVDDADSNIIAQEVAALLADPNADFQSDDALELLVDIMDALDAISPEGCYFGGHEGDGADIGWWSDIDGD